MLPLGLTIPQTPEIRFVPRATREAHAASESDKVINGVFWR